MADTFPKNTIDDNGLKKVWDMVMNRLGLKVDKEAGKGLSTNDYTTAEKNKLAGIESGAEVNTVTSVAGKTGAVTLDKSDVGLSNVGNFKAVSTSANQGLTDTEKSNARANIDTPSNGDIQSSITVPKASVVTVTDAAPNNAEDITVDIMPIQDLHGYDRPWAGGGWKNKLNTDIIDSSYTFRGVDVTIDGGVLTLDGTATDEFLFPGDPNQQIFKDLLPSTNYIYSTGTTDTKILFYYKTTPSSSWSYGGESSNGILNFTTPSSYEVIWVRMQSPVGTVYNNKKIYPMIRLSTETDATFAPYSNICPIEGRTGAELDRVGKNWAVLDTSHIQSINGQNNDSETYTDKGVTVTSTGSYGRCGFEFKVIQGETYTVSMKAKKSASVGAGGVLLGSTPNWDYEYIKFDNNQITTDFTILNQTITAETDTLYIGIYPVTSGVSVTVENLQLELGTQPTAYEPYQGEQYTASFGETVYGGKWHVTEGGTDKTHANIANYNGETINEPWLSSLDEYSPGATPTIGAQVVYPLTTPTTISTPKQNVPMLKGINTVYADCGDTQLKYQPDNVIGELKGEIEDSIIYEDYKWTTESSRTYSAGTPGTYGCSSWRDVKKEGYDVIGVTFVENRRFGDCILTLYYIPSTSRVEVIIFRATSSAVTIADEDIEYRVAYKKH